MLWVEFFREEGVWATLIPEMCVELVYYYYNVGYHIKYRLVTPAPLRNRRSAGSGHQSALLSAGCVVYCSCESQTAWIKGPVLPGFCVNDPPAVGSSRLVPLLEDAAAVVRGGWNWSPWRFRLQIRLLGRAKPNQWLVEILVSVAVEVSPVGTKPPAAVGERSSKDGRHDSDAASPHSTTT